MLRALLFFLIIAFPAHAQDDDFPRRLVLAEKMLEIYPAKDQLENAVDAYISQHLFAYPRQDQEIFRTAMLNVMNPKALEKKTVDAYAETYTLAELEAMVEYYSKPEAKSARQKQALFDSKLAPELIRVLDQALMKMRTAAKKMQQ